MRRNRGALLAGLDGDLGDDAGDEEVEFLGAGGGIGSEQGKVQGVRLGEEAGAAIAHAVQAAEVLGRIRRTGEGDGVLFGQMVEERSDVTGDELDGTIRQQTGLDHVGHDGAGQVGSVGGGFDDDGDTGDEHGAELLEHAPDGEVEGVDLECQTLPGGEDMAADEGAVLRQALDSSVEVDRGVGHLPTCHAGVGEEGADAAFDVDESVALGRAGGKSNLVVVLGPLHEVGAELLQDHAALVEGQLLQFRDAGGPRVLVDGGEVDAGRGDVVGQLPVGRIVDGSGAFGAPARGHASRLPHPN